MRLVLSAVAVASLCASPVWAQSDKSENTETNDTRPEPPMLGKHLAKGQGARPAGVAVAATHISRRRDFTVRPWCTDLLGHHLEIPAASQIEWNLAIDVLQHNGELSVPELRTRNTPTALPAGAPHVTTAVTVATPLSITLRRRRVAHRPAPIQAEVCAEISTPVANGYYPVYVDTPRGHAGFCAWHSWGTCGGAQSSSRSSSTSMATPAATPGTPSGDLQPGLGRARQCFRPRALRDADGPARKWLV